MSSLLIKLTALLLLVSLSPLLLILFLLVKLTSSGPFLYTQPRLGRLKQVFLLIKIRTMVKDAEKTKKNLLKFNEADGPVFKIRNDPRYTQIGKFLSHNGLDEIPQLINIILGQMTFVGPRPLPVDEARRIDPKYDIRYQVLPGITSLWVVEGAHKLSFKNWMELDLKYVKNRSLRLDFQIIINTLILVVKSICWQIKG